MTMCLAAVLFVVTIIACPVTIMAQKHAIQDLKQYGIRLHAAGDLNYESDANKLLSEEQRNALGVLREYSVTLKNNSNRAIVGYSLTWDITKSDGTVESLTTTNVAPRALLDGSKRKYDAVSEGFTVILPAQPRLLLPNLNLGYDPIPNRFPGEDSIRKLTAKMINASEVRVRADAILFEDGRFIGPDPNDLFSVINNLINAEQDIYAFIVSSKRQGASNSEIEGQVRSIAEQSLANIGPRSDAYQQTQIKHATEFLRISKQVGIDNAIQIFATRAYHERPILRRIR